MGTGIIKNIIISLILMVLAFVVGSMAADGARGSLLILGGIVGAFFLLYLGKNCWWLIFVLPPLLSNIQLWYFSTIPPSYLVCAVVLVYWLLLRMMGYVKVVWHGVAWMDLLTLLLFVYYAYTYYLNPVELMAFSDADTEYVGGKEYVICLSAAVCYLALSIVPCTLERLHAVLRWAFFAQLAICALMLIRYKLGGLGYVGNIVYVSMACKYTLLGLVMAPWKLILMILALSLTLYGQREVLLKAGFLYIGISVVKKQLVLLTLAAGLIVGLLTYLSSENVLLLLPDRIQRTLYILPWMNIKRELAEQAQHSSDWRKEMWTWAMDPRTRYIRDYVWGDGFGISMKLLRLTTISLNRGAVTFSDQQRFAETGVWHSGVFTALHRVGIVGLSIMVIWNIAALFLIARICAVLDKRKQGFYLMYFTMPFWGLSFTYYISAGTIVLFFSNFHLVAMAKIAYSEAIRTGIMPRLFTRQQYIPLAIREMEAPPVPVAAH